MTNSMVMFPLVEKQICNNCQITLDSKKLWNSMVNMTEDAYGMPAVMVRCPVCKTLFEWETKGN